VTSDWKKKTTDNRPQTTEEKREREWRSETGNRKKKTTDHRRRTTVEEIGDY
jgi:hypothetical protein